MPPSSYLLWANDPRPTSNFMGSTSSKSKSPTQATKETKRSDMENTPRSMTELPVKENPLAYLKLFDTVLIIDDSASMEGSSWRQTRKALEELARVALQYDTDGIEIHFLNSKRRAAGIKSAQDIMDLFHSVRPNGATPLGRKLDDLLTAYITGLDKRKGDTKPVNYIVITDGVPTDSENLKPEPVIVRAARALDERYAKLSQVGIQFVQVGGDRQAKEFLESLDDNLKAKHNVRDMVDTTPSNAGQTLDIVKVLMGAINRRVDHKGSAAFGATG